MTSPQRGVYICSRPPVFEQSGSLIMAHANAGHNVTEIYKSVVNDVIAQVREAFLDENVDIDILQQLKKEWEDKVNASGCVDWEKDAFGRSQNVAPPAMRPTSGMIPQRMNPSAPPQRIQASSQGLPVHGHPVQMNQMHMEQRTVQPQVQYVQQQSLAQPHIQVPMSVFTNAGGMRMGVVPQQQHAPFMLQGQPQMVYVQNPGGGGQPVTLAMGPNGPMLQARASLQPGQIPQLDGTGEVDEEEEPDLAPETSTSRASHPSKPSRADAVKVLNQLLGVIQLDGGGGGMSDSSSEDEEENDPLSRLADRIGGNGEIEDAEDVVEEDPLNSEDDQSDDEDLTTLFDADNVIMCQFEKVNRARNKWKFQLKDGIMHLNDRDYCFQRCIGEAEW